MTENHIAVQILLGTPVPSDKEKVVCRISASIERRIRIRLRPALWKATLIFIVQDNARMWSILVTENLFMQYIFCFLLYSSVFASKAMTTASVSQIILNSLGVVA